MNSVDESTFSKRGGKLSIFSSLALGGPCKCSYPRDLRLKFVKGKLTSIGVNDSFLLVLLLPNVEIELLLMLLREYLLEWIVLNNDIIKQLLFNQNTNKRARIFYVFFILNLKILSKTYQLNAIFKNRVNLRCYVN